MSETGLNTPGQGGENIQEVKFEELYTGLQEVRDIQTLQDKLTIANCASQIPLLLSLSYYGGSGGNWLGGEIGSQRKRQLLESFPNITKDQGMRMDTQIYYASIRGTLITISKCYEYDDQYIFISDLGDIFAVNKEDFNTNRYLSKSLKLLLFHQVLGEGPSNVSDNDGKVKYYLGGKLEGTLQGSCFRYVERSDSKDEIYVGYGSCIYKSTLIKGEDAKTNEEIISHDDSDAIDLGLGEIQKLALDPNQNLLFVISKDEAGNSNLHILEHKKIFNEGGATVKEIKTIAGVFDIEVLSNGDIVLLKSNGTADILNTNLNALKNVEGGSFKMKEIIVKVAANQTKQDLLSSLGDGIVVEDTNDVSYEGEKEDLEILDKIRGSKIEINGESKTLKELLDDATTEDDIKKVEHFFKKILEQNEQLKSVPELLEKIKSDIKDKKDKIIGEYISSELGDISVALGESSDDLDKLKVIREKLKNIQKKRKKIVGMGIISSDNDEQLRDLLITVDQKIKDYQELHKDEFEQAIEDNLVKIKEKLDNIYNLIEVSSVMKEPIWEETKYMISSLEENLQSLYMEKLNGLRAARRKELLKEIAQEKEKYKQVIENKKKEIVSIIEEITQSLEGIDDIGMVEKFEQEDPMVLEVRVILSTTPGKNEQVQSSEKDELDQLWRAEAEKLAGKLENVFIERKRALRGYEIGEEGTKNLDSYGIDKALYYNEDGSEQVEWKIEGEKQQDGKIGLVLKLMNGETHEYDHALYLKEGQKFGGVRIKGKKIHFNMEPDEFDEYLSLLYEWKEEGKSKKYYDLIKRLRSQPLTGKNTTDIPAEKKKILAEIKKMRERYGDMIYTEHLVTRLIKQQRLNPRSQVPERDPNYIVLDEEKQSLQTLSARLLDQRQNGGIEILAGGPGLGKTVMCKFLASVTNREIITVQCSKMDPNDLFYATTLKHNVGTAHEPAEWIKYIQKPGTIVLFDEVDKLSADCFARLHDLCDSRRTVSDPREKTIKANPDCLILGTMNCYGKLSNPINNRGRILKINYPGRLNEAFKVSKYTNNSILKKMSFEKFKVLYEKYVTRGESSPTNAAEKKIYDMIININHLLNVFEELRKTYGGDEPFVYELSYRDARQIFVDLLIDYDNDGDFKKAMKNILVPKAEASVDDPEEKREQEELVIRAIDKEMG